MTHQDDHHPAEMPEDQPSMELLDGAEQASPARPSVIGRLVRGSLYGVLVLSATALLAVSAIPELAEYATFIPDSRTYSTCGSKTSACTALSVATANVATFENVEGSPCSSQEANTCPLAAMAAKLGGCSQSCEGDSEEVVGLAAVSADLPACCLKGSSCSKSCEEAVLADAEETAPVEQLLSDDQLALLPEGEDLD